MLITEIVIIIGLALLLFLIGFLCGGVWVNKIHDEALREQGPPVRWSPEEYEIIKQQSK